MHHQGDLLRKAGAAMAAFDRAKASGNATAIARAHLDGMAVIEALNESIREQRALALIKAAPVLMRVE
jgi:hypothetical protein